MKKAQRHHVSKGFTLIELLIVITIMAILAELLFPVFSKAREKARSVTCHSNLRQLGIAIGMYASDNDSVFPKRENVSNWNTLGGWMIASYPYVKNRQVFLCPSDDDPYAPSGLSAAVVQKISYMSSSYAVSNPPKDETQLDPSAELMFLGEANVGGEIRQGDMDGNAGPPGNVNERVELNHFGGFNVLYVDGHVKWLSYEKAIANRASLHP